MYTAWPANLAEEVQALFPNVNNLQSSAKAVVKKAPQEFDFIKRRFRTWPSEPVLTRWGTWLDTEAFYAKKFEKLSTVVKKLPVDSEKITLAKKILEITGIGSLIAYIDQHFVRICKRIFDV